MNPESLPLRDIHLPGAVSPWPPGPFWWWLAGASLLALLALGWWLWRRKSGWFRQARAELERLEEAYTQDGDGTRLAAGINRLLKRVARHRLAGHPEALTGEAWLAALDEPLESPLFAEGAGRALVDAPYRPRAEVDGEALLAAARAWLDAVARRGHG